MREEDLAVTFDVLIILDAEPPSRARDFFERLPAGRIDPEVARQHDEHCRDSQADS